MGEVLGADPEQLETLAGRFERRAAELSASRSSLTSMLSSVPWVGADADRFRSTWRRDQSRHLDLVVDDLREMAAGLRREAADQRRTSGGVGLGAGSPTTIATAPTGGAGSPAGPAGPDEVAHRAVAAIDDTGRQARRAVATMPGPTLVDLRANVVGDSGRPDAGVPAGGIPVLPLLGDQPSVVPSAGTVASDVAPGTDWAGPVRDGARVRAELDRWW